MALYVNEAVIAHSFLALKAEKTSLPYALRTIALISCSFLCWSTLQHGVVL